jgi:hypothetical protein
MRDPNRTADLAIVQTVGGRWAVHMGSDRIHEPLLDAATAVWVRDLYDLDVRASDPRWDEVGGKQSLTHRDCSDNRGASSRCEGPVEYTDVPSRAGRPLPLCHKHAAARCGTCCRLPLASVAARAV